jgi:hypothetical protein
MKLVMNHRDPTQEDPNAYAIWWNVRTNRFFWYTMGEWNQIKEEKEEKPTPDNM